MERLEGDVAATISTLPGAWLVVVLIGLASD